ncbi:MAG: hypothetical protein SF097_28150 [Acidobacteriota bacterium]|nr:hypothetical protein [Acidobacteriota bacterium]
MDNELTLEARISELERQVAELENQTAQKYRQEMWQLIIGISIISVTLFGTIAWLFKS